MTSRFNLQPITPGRRPNERQNPELEVLLRQVSPKLNAEVEPVDAQAAVEQILGKELAEGVTPMPETLAQQIRAEINKQFEYPDPAKHGAEDAMIDDVEPEWLEYDEDGVEPEVL